ncbi:MAG: DUF4215 domain-containing protein [Deltaproteobacteria bacterium]|nr:MAG: DUF4215 domain-containing protein [Deltaproteobacteria bacterium]
MTIGGTLTSVTNRLEYLDPAKAPQVAAGAVVVPPPVIAQNSLLPPCGTPPPRCGNGIVEDGEECDDGNNAPCDGCSASCTTEGCGNGVVECDEQCDDGARNGTTGDGCDASCRLVGTIRYLPASHVDSRPVIRPRSSSSSCSTRRRSTLPTPRMSRTSADSSRRSRRSVRPSRRARRSCRAVCRSPRATSAPRSSRSWSPTCRV